MADAYIKQKNKGDYGGLSFDDRLQLLVQAEWLHRFDRRVLAHQRADRRRNDEGSRAWKGTWRP